MVCTHVRVELAWVTEFLAVAKSNAADKHGEQKNVLDAVESALPLLRWSIGGWFLPWAKSKRVLRSSPMKGWGEPSNHRSITPADGNKPGRLPNKTQPGRFKLPIQCSASYGAVCPETLPAIYRTPAQFSMHCNGHQGFSFSCEFLPPLLLDDWGLKRGTPPYP